MIIMEHLPCNYSDSWHNGDEIVAVIHLCAPNDNNGNPRRCHIGLDSASNIVAVLDDGYRASSPWLDSWFHWHREAYAPRIEVTPRQYRAAVALIEHNRGQWGIIPVGSDLPNTRRWTQARARRAAKNATYRVASVELC